MAYFIAGLDAFLLYCSSPPLANLLPAIDARCDTYKRQLPVTETRFRSTRMAYITYLLVGLRTCMLFWPIIAFASVTLPLATYTEYNTFSIWGSYANEVPFGSVFVALDIIFWLGILCCLAITFTASWRIFRRSLKILFLTGRYSILLSLPSYWNSLL